MFNLVNLDAVRQEMIAEIKADIEAGKLYISDRLNPEGKANYPKMLLIAAESMDIEGFCQILGMAFFSPTYLRKTPSGGVTQAKMPYNANETLCEGEFNRFYIRAVCIKAISLGQETVIAYRARPSTNPRPESLRLEGREFQAEQLLNDLREKIGVDTVLGLPPGPNSGISVKMIH